MCSQREPQLERAASSSGTAAPLRIAEACSGKRSEKSVAHVSASETVYMCGLQRSGAEARRRLRGVWPRVRRVSLAWRGGRRRACAARVRRGARTAGTESADG